MKSSFTNYYQDQIAQRTTLCELKELLTELARDLNFDYFIFVLRWPVSFADSEIITIDGYPEGWVEHYFKNEYYKSDPVISWCLKNILPIHWRSLNVTEESLGAKMMEDAERFGLKDGCTVPVHGPLGQLGMLSMAVSNDLELAKTTIINAAIPLQVLSPHIQNRVTQLQEQQIEKSPSITDRERECLIWAANGKSSNEISQLLSISEATVNFHLNNVMKKLKVYNRQHAISKASLKRLVRLNPF